MAKTLLVCPFCYSDEIVAEDKASFMLYKCQKCRMNWMETKKKERELF